MLRYASHRQVRNTLGQKGNKVQKISLSLFTASFLLFSVVGCVSTGEVQKKELLIEERNQALQKAIKEKESLEKDIRLILSEDIRAKNILKLKEDVKKLESVNAELNSEVATLQRIKENLESRISQTQDLKTKLNEKEQLIKTLNEKIELLSNPLSLAALEDWILAQDLQGSMIFGQDDEHTYLGIIDFTNSSIESIFKIYGTYGSEYSSSSIWNEYGTFGSEYSSYSPFNEYTSTPPVIIKNRSIVGHLTENEYLSGAVSVKKIKSIYQKLNE